MYNEQVQSEDILPALGLISSSKDVSISLEFSEEEDFQRSGLAPPLLLLMKEKMKSN